jgi:hypothetical protein
VGRRSSIPISSDIFVKVAEPRTLRAWEPFGWCVNTLCELQHTEIDDEHPEWIRSWIFGVTVLRNTGHVLGKIDTPCSDKHKRVMNSHWDDWHSRKSHHWIFHEFIEKERNSILKTFQLGVQLDSEGIWHEEFECDGLQLFAEATYWWRAELEAIEAALAQ